MFPLAVSWRRVGVALGVVFATSGSAVAQPFVQVGSARDRGGSQSEWALGVGYEFEFLLVPVSVVALGQTGSGVEIADSGRQYPLRGYLAARMGFLPLPGFGVYAGAGGGVSTRAGGGAELAATPSLIALGGFETGRLHLEVQFQRDLGEVPVNRWVTAIGLAF